MNNFIYMIIAIVVMVGGLIVYLGSTTDSQPTTPSESTRIQEVDTADEQAIRARSEEEMGGTQDSAHTTDTGSAAERGVTVSLSGNGLTQVPGSVFEQRDTEVLDLSNNNLSGSLQAEVRFLTQLRVLNLSDNAFTGVPAEVGQLSQLEILNLANNPLTGLPHEIGNLKNLSVLDLRGTQYSVQDLEVIKQGLPSSVEILID